MATFARARRASAQQKETVLGAVRNMAQKPASSRVPTSASPAAPWSFADVAIAARGTGSTALDAEERDGPVGQSAVETAPAQPAPPTQPAAPAPAAPTSPVSPASPATTSAPAIASLTMKSAPSGAADTRKRVGVGEEVAFGASAVGTWTASAGTPAGPSAQSWLWKAPAVAATVTVTLTAGPQTATDTITVVAPDSISMRNAGSHTAQVGAGGACMLNEVTFNPRDLCLGAIQWLEVPGPGTSIDGFFNKYSAATLHHDPNPNYALVNDNNIMEPGPNNGARDHCSWHSTDGPYSDGAFEWIVPNRYIIDGEAASDGRWFTDTTQHFTMDAAGNMTITKAGAST